MICKRDACAPVSLSFRKISFTNAEVAARKLMTLTAGRGFTAFFDSVLAAEKYLERAKGDPLDALVSVPPSAVAPEASKG